MIFFLTSQPFWLSGAIIVGLGSLLSMLGPILGPILVRRYVHIERLAANNEIAGFKFATIGVLYAVFLAFAIIVVWEKLSFGKNSVTPKLMSCRRPAPPKHVLLVVWFERQSGSAVRVAVAG